MDVIGVIPARKVVETAHHTIAVDKPQDLDRVKEYLSKLEGLE